MPIDENSRLNSRDLGIYTTYNQNSYKQIKGIERMQYRESLMCFFIYYIVVTFLFD